MVRHVLTASVLLATFLTHAKTPGEVYEQAAKSTVVVRNIDSRGKPKSMGSGVVLPDKNVVTNCHVVKGASQLTVRIGAKEFPATLRYSDWDRDVCSLSVSGISAPAVVIGSTKMLKVGAKVYAIGAPKGLELTLSDGIVSNLRGVEGGQYIQITAAISPGSSGGGLFDENGSLIGLTTFYLAEGQNLNFAVPVEWVKDLPKRSAKIATVGQTAMQWLNKAIELESRKDWPALVEYDRRWTKAQPASGVAWFSLGIAYGKAGQSAKAIEAYQEVLRINPEDASAWNNLGNVYGKAGQSARAIEAFEQALRIDPEYAMAWNNLGIDYGDIGQHAKAIEAYQQAVRIDPEYSAAWSNLGAAYASVGQPAKAIEAHQHALGINPEYAGAWYNLGIAYAKAGQSPKAIDAYQQALRINPEYASAWYNLGIAYGKADKFAKAIEAYQQALRVSPEHASALYNLGIAYANAGQRTNMLEVYKRLKSLDPSSAESFFKNVVMP